ncbi:MAG: nitrous oxide reductase accessory protein NosL [gamma proteobacterium endosymbiont of Lamellibrachia anaximandri]|nr:nitrous oxide reductase accessory protein NosL [gamma proteobacterium endosymbiont of Lamellibrachia anaximandri]MBL3533878.1 nitrous oxide reductase accessory protein NosL [gamma proteobacterium endosymbiont of Lamellibrachia anaximandri]
MNTNNRFILIIILGFLLLAQPVVSGSVDLPKPGPTDTCPVCGMFVAKYPEWVATVRYKDGHAHHFDGAKDLFKYLLDLPKWAPGHQAENIDSIGVTEYYGLALIDAHEAFYVIGSDVLGPMGHELIPLETKEDAEEFLRDHKGLSIIRFNQVVGEMLIKLDNGVFE